MAGLLVGASLVATACGGGEGKSGKAEKSKEGNDKVSLLLSFLPDMIGIQYLLAQDMGHFKQCGIDFEWKSAAEVENALQLVVGGSVDYAVIDPLSYVAGIHKGLPVVAIATDTPKTAVAYASFAEKGVAKPEDLPGNRVGIQPGLDSQLFLEHIIKDLPESERKKVKTAPVGFDLRPLLTKSVDVITLWPTNTNIAEEQAKGTKFNLIKASDYGVTVPGNVLVTTKARVEKSPDQVKRVLAAFTAGQAASLDPANSDRAVSVVRKLAESDIPAEIEADIYKRVGELKQDPAWKEKGIGWNTDEAYGQAQTFLKAAGEIDKELPVQELYTNKFLEELNAGGFSLDKACS
jgi:ABC-type nitrate/sulfonate/bicarbonate transport system substrate-binding protein